MEKKELSTHDDACPVFKNWSSWYWIIIIANILTITSIYLIFKFI